MPGPARGFFTRNKKKRPLTRKVDAAGNSVAENASRLIKLVSMSEQAKLERARQSDLITLPKGISGTNCGNCRYAMKMIGSANLNCVHTKVLQTVTERNCCIYWDAPGTVRDWKK